MGAARSSIRQLPVAEMPQMGHSKVVAARVDSCSYRLICMPSRDVEVWLPVPVNRTLCANRVFADDPIKSRLLGGS